VDTTGRLPVLPLAQVGDVRGVMTRVPCVEGENRGKILAAVFRMVVAALEVRFRKGLEQCDPALVEGCDHRDGAIDRKAAICQAGPGSFVIRLDSGPIFSEGQLVSDVGVGMAVGDVVYELANGPAAFAIGCVELGVGKAVNGGLQTLRKSAQVFDMR